jgi:hypothetical protein
MASMGRPKKKPGKARERLMQVRLQTSEYDHFKEAADSAGLDLSSWVRERLKIAVRKEMRTAKDNP